MAADLLTTIRSELDARLRELRPLLSEYERLLQAVDALEVAHTPPAPKVKAAPKPRAATPVPGARRPGRPRGSAAAAKLGRAPRGAARQAIIAALEHGSHTISELVMVTAMTGPNININIRRLLAEGTIGKTTREGKTAYALPSSISA